MINLQILFAIVFVIVLSLLLVIGRKRIQLQRIFFPFIYIILYRTKVGIKFMDWVANKYREYVKLFGYISIGVGFIGMAFISYAIIAIMVKLVFQPETTTSSMVLVLPFTNIPGIGFLPFTHWIIAIFILAVVHEFSHGVVARAHGLEVKASGFAVLGLLVPIIPAAFVEPDEKKMAKQSDVVQYSILSAGPVSNIALAFIILGVMLLIFVPVEAKLTNPLGFSFDLTNETLPAAEAGLENGMIVIEFNDEEVKDYTYFLNKMQHAIEPGDNITFKTENETFVVATVPNPEDPSKPLIGVSNIRNEAKVVEGREGFASVFFWFKDLFKWLFLLNFFIGLANLMPLGIVDGGRMLQISLHKLVKDKKRAQKIWSFISIMFLVFLFFGLITTYVGNPFAFFS